MEDLLQDWGFPDLIDIFKENEIDKDVIIAMEEHHLKELVPQLGKRIKLYSRIKALQLLEASVNNSIIINVQDKYDDAFEQGRSPSISTVSSGVDSEYQIVFSDDMPNQPDDVGHETETLGVVKNAFMEATKRKRAFYGEEDFKRACREVHNLDLKMYLERTTTGKFLLAKYNIEPRFSRQMRSQMSYLLVSGLMADNNDILVPLDFEILSEKIVELFPTETKPTYYIPRVRGNNKNKPINAKGKLIDKYRNLKRMHKLPSNESKATESVMLGETPESTDEINNAIEWLKNNVDPWDLVMENWKKTIAFRKINSCKTVNEYYTEWPILRNKNAYELVAYDFQESFNTTIKSLVHDYLKWEQFFEDVKNLYPLERVTEEFISPLTSDEVGQDSRNAIKIAALALFFPPKARIRAGKKHWKPSSLEAQQSIINHVSTSANIAECIHDRREKLRKLQLTLQPFMIVVGRSISNITDTYIIVDDNKYRATSVLQGLDFLFKSFHVLNAEYPRESQHIWLIIEKVLFKIEGGAPVTTPHISTILNELGY